MTKYYIINHDGDYMRLEGSRVIATDQRYFNQELATEAFSEGRRLCTIDNPSYAYASPPRLNILRPGAVVVTGMVPFGTDPDEEPEE